MPQPETPIPALIFFELGACAKAECAPTAPIKSSVKINFFLELSFS
jgi:hypothetical protein